MAAADTTTVLALSAARGSYGPMTTVQQSTSFQRAVVGQACCSPPASRSWAGAWLSST